MAHLFISAHKRVAFEWFMKLPAGSIKTWADLEKLFLAHFFEDDLEISVQLTLQPSRRKESLLKLLSKDFRAWHSPIPAAWPSLHWLRHIAIICKLSSSLKWEWLSAALGSSWSYKANMRKKLYKVTAEEKDSRPRPDRPMRRALESSSLPRRRYTLATNVKSPLKPQPVRGGEAFGQARANKLYSFKNEHVVSLFKLLQNGNKLKLPEARCPEEVGKIDDPSYCIYHRILGHPTKNCYIFKDVL